jgi:hypothetical protein
MNFGNIERCEISNTDIVISRKVIVKFIFIMLYLCIYFINKKKINTKLNKELDKEDDNDGKDINKWYIVGNGAARYKGKWKNGMPNGKGIKEYFKSSTSQHSIVECNFVDGKYEGYGKQIYDITEEDEIYSPYYEGEFKNSKYHGNGIYYYGDGTYHKGEYQNGMYHGKGIYYEKKPNKSWVGIYADDKRIEGKVVDGELE